MERQEIVQKIRQYWYVGVIVLLAGVILWGWQSQHRQQLQNKNQTAMTSSQVETPSAEKAAVSSSQEVKRITHGFVELKGAVAKPGIYQITANSRLFDVVTEAGGYLENADTTQMNGAQKLTDQDYIYIPQKGEAVQAASPTAGTTDTAVATATTGTAADSASDGSGTKVNLNQADASALQQLNGIGPKKAEQIVAYREEQGSFATIEDLQKVSGIGAKTFESLKDHITV
ncbi:hypothetical protein IV38_GL000282 [Lactobacillus selangorensis]|uniref:Helix-hairpin-helix DNA-binding motif class 1 domain-containing protein n=1 Tax=Lactobacillus selangorensis TaxID=81857 RepID=A0A0R2FZV2_9LACO|nr:helix-hairpin-helix domain-containing protein [Lactobacillus selangorensis]KRN29398.1 hypothetical protein IV38_GL000282 [Lactobacillus selangorensis]KRN34073.1 hypothetical protein IV40_GL000387 [Lactobacillus selangorensis]